MIAIGFDTSNYTTSCASFSGSGGKNVSRLLPVKEGELGLRQSDALFHHIKRLPELSDSLFASIPPEEIHAIGVSTRPRAVEGSYMPCFLAGESHARLLSSALHVPLYTFSHQQGHIAAALYSANRLDLLGKQFLAWHLSGGTTELLLVNSEDREIRCQKIGGSTDISAGQLIDRTGHLLDIAFPSGKALDALATESQGKDSFRVNLHDLEFSFSGVENQVQKFYEKTGDSASTARFALRSVANTVRRVTIEAQKVFPYPVVFSGGVASNQLLRQIMSDLDCIFAEPVYSTDNAMGIAVLTYLREA